MANEVLQKTGTQIRFFVTGSFSPVAAGTNWTIGTPTDVVMTLASLANAAGRQSTKVDLGATRAVAYSCLGCVDFTGETPVSGSRIDYYWAPSVSGTAATGNIAGNDGVDGTIPTDIAPVVTGITLAEYLKLCIYIGSLITTDDATVQNGFIGILRPPTRYGQLIVANNSGDVFENDDVEMHQVLNPIVDEIQ